MPKNHSSAYEEQTLEESSLRENASVQEPTLDPLAEVVNQEQHVQAQPNQGQPIPGQPILG